MRWTSDATRCVRGRPLPPIAASGVAPEAAPLLPVRAIVLRVLPARSSETRPVAGVALDGVETATLQSVELCLLCGFPVVAMADEPVRRARAWLLPRRLGRTQRSVLLAKSPITEEGVSDT